MRRYILPFFFSLLFSTDVSAIDCDAAAKQFLADEKAYDVVVQTRVASRIAANIIGIFIKNGTTTREQCKTSMTIDRWVMSGRKIEKAKGLQRGYAIEDLNALRSFAINNPPRQTNYIRGRVVPNRSPR